MQVLIFKTDIRFKSDLNRVLPVFHAESRIKKWNIDTADIDNVLRIESLEMNATEVIQLINQSGYCCEELPD